jgi:hypothetical protein
VLLLALCIWLGWSAERDTRIILVRAECHIVQFATAACTFHLFVLWGYKWITLVCIMGLQMDERRNKGPKSLISKQESLLLSGNCAVFVVRFSFDPARGASPFLFICKEKGWRTHTQRERESSCLEEKGGDLLRSRSTLPRYEGPACSVALLPRSVQARWPYGPIVATLLLHSQVIVAARSTARGMRTPSIWAVHASTL